MSAAETFRAREVYKYYQPWDIENPPEPSLLSHDETHLDCAPPRPDNFKTQTSFSDTALTAFAQLIALRLEAQRAIVSLVDHENEYFLAESTSTLSSLGGAGPAQNAWLSISGARVPRKASLCEQTLRLVPNHESEAGKTPFCFVPDLRHDERLSNLDCVKAEPYLRFYCGVALRNQRGINIGCVYVVDEEPRSTFTLAQAEFLTTMAATVMEHLENIRAKEDIVRVTRMSQALHAFIEGDGTMEGDWQRLKKYNLPAGAGVGFHWESNKGIKDDKTKASASRKGPGVSVSTKNVPTASDAEAPTSPARSPLNHSGSTSDTRFNYNIIPWSSASEEPVMRSVFDAMSDTANGSRDTEFSNSGFSDLLHSTFSRASNLFREGMEVDGAVFFDAPFRFYQGRSTLETDSRLAEPPEADNTVESDDEDLSIPKFRLTPSPIRLRTGYFDVTEPLSPRGMPTDRNATKLKADVLGYSTRGSSSWNNQPMGSDTNFTAIDQSLLTSLVRHYPQGELFVYDEHGPVTPPVDVLTLGGSQIPVTAVVEAKRTRHERRKRADVLRLLAAFPGARQIFFVPLHDTTSGCFIGSFAWSTSATRIFSTENHLSYLVAFGHSVMSEVSRLNTLSADRAKGDFISNVSHELRSPLHGILGSVEFLADTALDSYQRNFVNTVDICGRTLLDTIEHVLDFSKIKKFRQQSSQPVGVVADLDISAVIEEVLEGVFAGFEFNGLSSQGLADTTRSRAQNSERVNEMSAKDKNVTQPRLPDELVTVILDMDFQEQWKFPTVPGTWRRLTMNLFGNCLKYTRNGYIKVKLEAKSIPSPKVETPIHEIGSTMVTLTISDTGLGISSDFLKTKLFKPFSQEDPTAPGTGLGMSIVKQIVDLSGGEINIRSELGKGTEVKLSLPLENCPGLPETPSPSSDEASFVGEDAISAVRRRAQGRKVTMCGFDRHGEQSEVQLVAARSLKASVEKYATDWFSLHLVSDLATPDIVIADESAFRDSSISSTPFKLLLILCSNGGRRDIYNSRLHFGQTVEFVSKPCGPHRLAKALLSCLDTEEAARKAETKRVGEATSPGQSPRNRNEQNVASTSAKSSNPRLTRDLQSSTMIGFAPTTTSMTLELPQHPSQRRNRKGQLRPGLTHRSSSHAIKTLSHVELSAMDSGIGSMAGSDSLSATVEEESGGVGLNVGSVEKGASEGGRSEGRGSRVGTQPKMLLVEDNPVNMMLLSTYMKKNGWDYEMATNGLLALQAFQNRPQGFDVIFMDVSMPVMTGYESTRAIRSIEAERLQAYSRQVQLLAQIEAAAISTPMPVLQVSRLDTEKDQSVVSDAIPISNLVDALGLPPSAVPLLHRPTNPTSTPALLKPISNIPLLQPQPQSFPFHLPTQTSPFSTCTSSSSTTADSTVSSAPPFSTSLTSTVPTPPPVISPLFAAPTITPLLIKNSPALIIALTGFSSQLDQEMAFEAGVDIFMTKPVRFREVGRVLEGWKGS